MHGFTLLEMMVVVAIIVILLSMAAGRYQRSVIHARETVMRHDLITMRKAIQEYTLDKQAAPQSLDDLVSGQYLREIPVDPLTQHKDWKVDTEDILLSPDQTSTGISDVHSSAPGVSDFDGTPYSSW